MPTVRQCGEVDCPGADAQLCVAGSGAPGYDLQNWIERSCAVALRLGEKDI